MRNNTLAILGGLALLLGSANFATACEQCGVQGGCHKDCTNVWNGYCAEGCRKFGRRGCDCQGDCATGCDKGCCSKGDTLKSRLSAIQKRASYEKSSAPTKHVATQKGKAHQKGSSRQKAVACQKGSNCQKGDSCQKGCDSCQKGGGCGKGFGKGCGRCGLFAKHRGCGCGDECGGCGGHGDGNRRRIGRHCGPMPQTCYQPRYGCYFSGNRHMHRYPAFHAYYYRRPYNYRNLFDYPWHAGLHEPTSLFSYNVPPEEDADDADPGFDNGNVSSPDELESIVPPLPESARRTQPSDNRQAASRPTNVLRAKFSR
ncbi:MAG: hypothetical protein MI757_00970 [Pirellulales bacterium]|nr:hypothetical protein [Pirellulales bacterium]